MATFSHQSKSKKNLQRLPLGQLLPAAFAMGIAVSLVFCRSSLADFQLHDWKLRRAEYREWNLSSTFGLFSTRTNRDGAGNPVRISGLEEYRRAAANINLDWGVHPKLTFFGRSNWLWNDIRSTTSSANRFGLSDQTLGMSLRLLERLMILDFQIQVDLPAYSNVSDASRGFTFLGDSSTDITLGGFQTLPLALLSDRSWTLVAGAGYTYRSASFSAAVPWSIEINTKTTSRSGFLASISAAGIQSLKTDPRKNNPGMSASQFLPESGGSFLVNAINPSLAATSATLGYRTSGSTEVSVSYRKLIWGQSVADGNLIEAGFRWNLSAAIPPRGKSLKLKTTDRTNEVVDYVHEGRITSIISTKTMLIDMGTTHGAQVGDLVDIFSVSPDHSIGEPVARAQIIQSETDRSQITILELYQETAIKTGFIIKKPLKL